MREEDVDFVTINMPLLGIFAQESKRDIKKKTLKRSVCDKTTRNSSTALLIKYTLPHNRLYKNNTFEHSLLPYRLYEKNLAKIIRKHRLAIGLEEKYKILNTELRNRLQVDNPPDDVQVVTDIDEGYFRYFISHARVEGIPLYKSLKFLYHKQMRMKQEIGYRRDDVLSIKTKDRKEVITHQDCVQIYMDQVKQFDTFISEDYARSIARLKKSETLCFSLLDEKITELQSFASRQFSIQSKLIEIDNFYYQQQKYGRFLYYVSRPNWRAKHKDFACSVEIEAKGFDLGTSSAEDTFNVIFENMKKECANGFVKPALYFSEPDELINIFESTQKQQLHLFSHVVQLKPRTEMLQKMIDNLKRKIQNDSAFIAVIIGDFEKVLVSEEERASQLKAKFMKILYGSFHDSVAAPDALHLQMNLEWCYERIFMEKSNTTIRSTAKALESMYMEYRYKLEIFGHEETKAALKQSIAEEKYMMNRAHKAAKELRLFNQLEKSLRRAHGIDHIPPMPVVTRPSTRKVTAPKFKPATRHSSHRQLTEAEIEYLRLFTDWTDKENPSKYLHAK